MKSKLFISGLLIFISLLTFSCTNDDDEIQNVNDKELKIEQKNSLKNLNDKINMNTVQDSVVKIPIQEGNITSDSNGDPSNPRPPRKD
jgi:hypothetical protein